MKLEFKGFLYESTSINEGYMASLLAAASDVALKAMGTGDLVGNTVNSVVDKKIEKDENKDKVALNEMFEPFKSPIQNTSYLGPLESQPENFSEDNQQNEDDEYDEESPYYGRRAAGCLFYSKETKRVLFGLRSISVTEPHTWAGFGGKLDGDETPIQGLERELSEEIGYTGTNEYMGVCVYEDPEYDFKYYSYLVIVNEEFEPKLNDENDDYVWVSIDDPPQPLHPGLAECMSHYIKAISSIESSH